MQQRKKYLLVFFILPFLMFHFTSEGKAQTDYSFSWYLIKDDNAFKSRNEYDELINTASFLISKGYSGKSFNIQGYYNANLSLFNNYKDQKNYTHQFGAAGRILSGKYIIDLGANALFRRNNAQYIYFNTDSYNFYLRLRYEPSLTKNYSLGLTIDKNRFIEFNDIDNRTYRFYGKFQHFFQSRLSISGEIGLGIRNYLNQTVTSFLGRRTFAPQYTEDPLNAMLFSVKTNTGKSITNNTGINGEIGGQWFIGDPIEAYLNGIYYYTENDLYDDPYSYEDRYISVHLTRQFTVSFQGKIGMKYQKKYYRGTPALTNEGDLTGMNREDMRKEYSFFLTKKFETKWRFPGSIELFFKFLIRGNSSNDPYYQFTDHLGIFGFTISK